MAAVPLTRGASIGGRMGIGAFCPGTSITRGTSKGGQTKCLQGKNHPFGAEDRHAAQGIVQVQAFDAARDAREVQAAE